MSRPVFVLVHGAWHTAAHWQPLVHVLESHQYKAITLTMPSSVAPGANPPGDCLADAAIVRTAVLSELEAGNDVIVVPHSYGGIPATSSLEGLDPRSRTQAGHQTSVVGIAGISSFILPEGKTIRDIQTANAKAQYEPLIQAPSDKLFYHDLADEEAKKWHGQLRSMARAALEDRSRYSAHQKIPVHFLLCVDDVAFSYHDQRTTVNLLRETGGRVRAEEVKTSRSPFLSQVQRTADFLRRSAGEQIPLSEK